MKTKQFLPGLIMLFISSTLFSQEILLQEFKSAYFDFSYPKEWKIDTSGHMYSFYYNQNLGDITISFYETEGLPDISIASSAGVMTCIYKYDADKVKYHLKAIQTHHKIYLISLNWNENSWRTFKDVLLSSFNSFKPK